MKSLGMVERLLADRIGLDPTSVGEGLIARGILARMSALGLRDRADYEWLLAQPGDEIQALIEECVVPESWFFRDARPFEVLREHARAGWLVDPSRPPMTLLSAPCAGGEEPYSLAIGLMDLGLPPGRFRVDAVDVSARSVAKAIAGVYGRNSFRGVEGPSLGPYFRDLGGAATINPEVRASVRFHLGNLLDPGLLADRPPFDVVFCRNLLIYFDAQARAAAFASIARLLADGGLLFLGHADRPDDAAGSPFSPMAEKGAFAYRKGPAVAVKPAVVRKDSGRSKGRSPGAIGGAASPFPRPPRVAVPVPPVPPVPDPVLPAQGRGEKEGAAPKAVEGSPLLDEAARLADAGRYDEASRRVDRAIAEGGASAGAYFLLGMIGQAAGDRGRAEAAFLKAVYLDAQHDEALLALALLAHRRGDVAAESVYRRRADRVRSRKGGL